MDRGERKRVEGELMMQGWSIADLPAAPGPPTGTYYDRHGRAFHDLPVDPYSVAHYRWKGFRLTPPEKPLPLPVPEAEKKEEFEWVW